MKLIFKIFLTILLYMSVFNLHAQDSGLGSWNMLMLKAKLNNKFSFQGEFNTKNEKLFTTYTYCEFKASVYYSLTRFATVSMGLGGFRKNLEGNFLSSHDSQDEIRTWGDLLMKHSYKRFYFDHRVRAEQRFFADDYQNRFRYRFAATIPVNKPTMTRRTLYLSAYDELFFGESHPVYERNRLYAGAGFKLNDNFSFQLGNMSQYDFKPDYSSRKGYIQLLIIYSITQKSQQS